MMPVPSPGLPCPSAMMAALRRDLNAWCEREGLAYFEAADALSAWVVARETTAGALVVAWLGFERVAQARSALVVQHQISLTVARGASLGEDRAAERDGVAGALPARVARLVGHALCWRIEPLQEPPEIQSCRPVLDRDGIPLDAYELRLAIRAPMPGPDAVKPIGPPSC